MTTRSPSLPKETMKRTGTGTRAEKSRRVRAALLKAAGEVVGERGYADASVARITMRAGVAQGTFYRHFNSQQEPFDELLPRAGQEMIEFVSRAVDPNARGALRERQRLDGYLNFLSENPGFYRVLYEAKTLAPHAYKEHIDNVVTGYKRSLMRSWDRDELPGYEESDIEAVAYMLTAIRDYFSLRYGHEIGDQVISRRVSRTYMKLICRGVFAEREVEERDSKASSA